MEVKIYEKVEGEGEYAMLDKEEGKIVLFDPLLEGFEGKKKIVGPISDEILPPNRIWVETDFFGSPALFALPEDLSNEVKKGKKPVETALTEFFAEGYLLRYKVPKAVASKAAEIFAGLFSVKDTGPDVMRRFAEIFSEKLKKEKGEIEDLIYESLDALSESSES